MMGYPIPAAQRQGGKMRGIVVFTSSDVCNAQLAIAAARAEETGILDLGYAADRDVQQVAIRSLAEQGGSSASWGCRWDTLGSPLRRLDCLADLPARPWPCLVVAGIEPTPDALRDAAIKARELATRVFLEVTTLHEAQAAEEAGFDGVVAKGYEAGGRVGQESAFILLQQLHGRLRIPFWIQGGIGSETAAAAFLAGAAGVVLGEQLWLTTESPLDDSEREAWAQRDGSETACVGGGGLWFRFATRPDRRQIHDLDKALAEGGDWPGVLRERLTRRQETAAAERLVPLGQEIALSGRLAARHQNVAGVLAALRRQVEENLQRAAADGVLGPQTPLAAALGTTYPILQGPMTRVSDMPPFAGAVAERGGLPFLALGLMRGPELEAMLQGARDRLGARPWGVGILGFLPDELRRVQLDAIRQFRPTCAIIAGGQPIQARQLEDLGIAAYLHVPSPGLLDLFLRDGARKFIFEGQECGGHVGPRTSFTLWQSAIDVLLDARLADPGQVHAIFAGGIHDALSSAMVAATAAPLAAQGMKVGVLLGSAYLFTEEAVACGAIGPEYQRQLLACRETVLLESGVGYATRCARTPYADEFDAVRRDAIRRGKSAQDIRMELERMNVGRLRLASKGLMRRSDVNDPDAGADLVQVDASTQRGQGLYMIGQVATMHQEIMPLARLHENLSPRSVDLLRGLAARQLPWTDRRQPAKTPGEPIAIVGMACMFPKARDLRQYWENILNRVDATEDVPPERWRVEDYFSPDRFAPDRVYSRRGGFLGRLLFDPLKWRITPASVKSIDPMQLMALEVAWQAMEDAGYTRRAFCRQRTGVIFAAAGSGDLGAEYCFRAMARHYLPRVEGLSAEDRQRVIAELESKLTGWTEDSFPGVLNNIVASRIANRLDLSGPTYTVDAACASSLAALHTAIEQLRLGTADAMLVGGVDGANNPFSYLCFAKTQALSPRGLSTPFDDAADGIVLSEGVAVVVLKRLADARRDGDKIYSVIRGIGSSSDGMNRSITAPYPPGQILALRRAYEDAGVPPSSVTLIEAHGTGTRSGDGAEITSLQEAFGDLPQQQVAVGSVKSMIGHTKAVAGLAGLVKTSLALNHRVLPPTIGIDTPNRQIDFGRSPFYLNTETRPWLPWASAGVRRAGVSAFGFGGTNFHVVLEEYTGDYHGGYQCDLAPRGAELFVWRRKKLAEILEALRKLEAGLEASEINDLGQLACAVWQDEQSRPAAPSQECRLAIVANSVQDLRTKMGRVLAARSDTLTLRDPSGIYYAQTEPATAGQVCFLYPGQGSQKVNMLRDLLVVSPWAHERLARADRLLSDELPQPLSRLIYPPPLVGKGDPAARDGVLNDTRIAQPALGVVELFATEVLRRFGLTPGMIAGHSFGEYVALAAAGCLGEEDLIRLSARRGRLAAEAGESTPGAMAMVQADAQAAQKLLAELQLGVELANLNAPDQTVIAGPKPAVEQAVAAITQKGLRTRLIPVTAAFHTSAMERAAQTLAVHLAEVRWRRPCLPVYSNTLAAPYPQDETEIRELLARHICRPVRFEEEVRRLYADGARVFVEVGPGRVLTDLVERILKSQTHTTLVMDATGRDGVTQLAHCLAGAVSLGLPVQLKAWFDGRGFRRVGTAELFRGLAEAKPKPTDWYLSPRKAEPLRPLPAPRAAGNDGAPAARAAAPEARPSPLRPDPVPGSGNGGPRTPSAPLAAGRPKTSNGQARPHAASSPMRNVPTTSTPERNTATMISAQPTEGDRQHRPQPAPGALAQQQSLLAQWLDLQQSQTRVTERFLAIQEQILTGRIIEPDGSGSLQAVSGLTESAAPAPLSAESISRVAPAPLASVGSRPPIVIPAVAGSGGGTGRMATLVRSPAPIHQDIREDAPMQSARVAKVGKNGDLRPTPSAAAPAGKAAPERETDETPAGELPSAEVYRRDLLRVVSERTGYPEDVLDEDMPLEAGLGIDSIKAIEIFTSLKHYWTPLLSEDDDNLEQFSKLKTLRDIVEAYDERVRAYNASRGAATVAPPAATTMSNAGVEPADCHNVCVHAPGTAAIDPGTELRGTQSGMALEPAPPSPSDTSVRRYRLALTPAPLDAVATSNRRFPMEHLILFLGEVQGLTGELEAHLASAGYRVRRVIPGSSARCLEDGRYEVELTSPQSWRRLHELLAGCDGRPVGALVNFLGLAEPFGRPGCDDPALARSVAQGLFHAFQEFARDLRESAERGGGRVLNLTALGGAFGLEPARPMALAAAGTLGVCKSVRKECPTLPIKNVDVGLEPADGGLWPRLLGELEAGDDLVEVAINQHGRCRIELVEDPPGKEELGPLPVDAESVILITGGACGISAEAARFLANAGPRLILAGRSVPQEEPAETRDLDEAALRNRLIDQARAGGGQVVPKSIDDTVREILKQREIRANLRALEAAGATVEYHAVDVRDAERFGRLIDEIYQRFGRLDGVIHGAGIVEDKLLDEKTPESFADVFRTKVDGALLLARKLRSDSLKFLVLFSSVSGRFGNVGQADYSAANELLNKLADELDRRWPGRVVAINWGPWQAGMVSPDLARLYESHGIALIGIEQGIRFLEMELRRPRGPAEVVVSCSIDRIASAGLECRLS